MVMVVVVVVVSSFHGQVLYKCGDVVVVCLLVVLVV